MPTCNRWRTTKIRKFSWNSGSSWNMRRKSSWQPWQKKRKNSSKEPLQKLPDRELSSRDSKTRHLLYQIRVLRGKWEEILARANKVSANRTEGSFHQDNCQVDLELRKGLGQDREWVKESVETRLSMIQLTWNCSKFWTSLPFISTQASRKWEPMRLRRRGREKETTCKRSNWVRFWLWVNLFKDPKLRLKKIWSSLQTKIGSRSSSWSSKIVKFSNGLAVTKQKPTKIKIKKMVTTSSLRLIKKIKKPKIPNKLFNLWILSSKKLYRKIIEL